MSQDWVIANIDKQEVIATWKLGEVEVIYGGIGYELYFQLLERQWKPVKEIMNSLRLPKRKDTPRSLGYMELPVELIQMVFSKIEDPWTAFRLGCANTQLLVIGEKRIHQLMRPPQWRGDRLIFVGRYCEEDDIPEGLDLGDAYKEFSEDNDSEDKGPYGWACTFDIPSLEQWLKFSMNNSSAGLENDCDSRITPDDIDYMMSKTISPAEKPSVLWNLSKKVYFRRESIPNDLPEAAKKLDSNAVMGNVLLLQIYWSTERTSTPSLSYGYNSGDVKIHRGKWAGDRFELTGNDVLESRLKEEGSKWEDVSEEVINIFVDVFETKRWFY